MPAGVLVLLVLACSPAANTTSSSTIDPNPSSSSTSQPPAVGMEIDDKLPGEELWALVPGNDPDSDRINLVFASWGWGDHREFLNLVTGALSWGGAAYLIDDGGQVTDVDSTAVGAALGLFAIEPWRSSRGVFNVWYTDLEPETPVSWLNSEDHPFQVDDVVVVTIAVDAERFNPDLTSVAGQDGTFVGPGAPERPTSGNPFSHAVVLVDSAFPTAGLVDVAHELGHAMFNLPDEYVGERLGFDGREDLSSWPSCAEDAAEAEEWWGDLDGDVDPMLIVWAAEMDKAGFPIGDIGLWSELIVVGVVDGGCYGVPGSARATLDSLMNTSMPVLGSVNRLWAEQVLRLWDGADRAPLG